MNNDINSTLQQFSLGKEIFQQISEGLSADQDQDVFRAIENFNNVNTAMASLALISPNELAQDVNTEDLQYILADFYLADLHSKVNDMPNRLRNLESSTGYYFRFLSRCEELQLISQKDLKEWKTQEEGAAPDPGAARQWKIEKFRKEQALNKRIQDLSEQIQNAKHSLEAGDDNADLEELERELLIITIEKSVSHALSEMKSIEEEKQLLQRFAPQVQEAALVHGSEKEDHRIKQRPEPSENRQGLMLTHLSKNDRTGEVMAQRERFKAGVFKPTVAPPTMTLEELAEIEIREAQERDLRSKEASKPDRRYEQLVQDGEEDEEKLVDVATYKDRAWDNWKDENPKGIGNKANKIF